MSQDQHAPQLFPSDSATRWDIREGDCLQELVTIPAASVDLVVTSPPYNLGIGYSKFDDTNPRDEYLEWCSQWAAAVRRVLKDNGSFFLNVGATPSNPLLPHELVLQLRSSFELQNTLHWIKSLTVTSREGLEISVGHFKPIQSNRYVTDCHEYIFHLTKSGNVPVDRRAVGVAYADKSNIARWGHTGGEDRRCRGNNWFIPYKTIKSRVRERPHPATFPVQLATMCIRLHGVRPNLTMLDPFLGIGHSALAARECGIEHFIGFDIDPVYLAEARSQLGL